MLIRIIFCIFLLSMGISSQIQAQEPFQEQPLKVGITEVPPFVIAAEDDRWEGISIDLWKEIAVSMSRCP